MLGAMTHTFHLLPFPLPSSTPSFFCPPPLLDLGTGEDE